VVLALEAQVSWKSNIVAGRTIWLEPFIFRWISCPKKENSSGLWSSTSANLIIDLQALYLLTIVIHCAESQRMEWGSWGCHSVVIQLHTSNVRRHSGFLRLLFFDNLITVEGRSHPTPRKYRIIIRSDDFWCSVDEVLILYSPAPAPHSSSLLSLL
jgi:hypothetical protein